jgi:hypothetical protein
MRDLMDALKEFSEKMNKCLDELDKKLGTVELLVPRGLPRADQYGQGHYQYTYPPQRFIRAHSVSGPKYYK